MSKNTTATQKLSVKEVLDLRYLPDEGLAYDEPLDAAWLNEQLQDLGKDSTAVRAAPAGGSAKIDVEPLAAVASRPPIRIHGHVRAELSMTCVRCLEPMSQSLDAELDLTLFAEGNADQKDASEDEEGDIDGRLDEGTYGANSLDMPAIVREALILEVAMHPRCADEDACSQRTEEMLAKANRDAEAAVDDRWAALRSMVQAAGPGEGGENN